MAIKDKQDLVVFLDNCPLNQSLLESLLDDLNDIIEGIVHLALGEASSEDTFYDPFSRTMNAWVKEEADKERLLSEKDITEMNEEVHVLAKMIFNKLIDKDKWFCFTYRYNLSTTYEAGLVHRTIVRLTPDKTLVTLTDGADSDKTTSDMIKLAEKVIRMIF